MAGNGYDQGFLPQCLGAKDKDPDGGGMCGEGLGWSWSSWCEKELIGKFSLRRSLGS